MADAKLKNLLRQNPGAKKHEESIRGALEDIKKLRDAGFGSKNSPPISPYGRSGQMGIRPVSPFREQLKSYFRVTFSA